MISCNSYDYIEIACMHNMLLRLTLLRDLEGKTELKGKAQTTKIMRDKAQVKQEYIVLTSTSGNSEYVVKLDDIATFNALDVNPHFKTVDFINGVLIK